MKLTISELSKNLGLSNRAIRYYEKLGLIELNNRANNNYRLYSTKNIKQFESILFLKRLGLTLNQIKELLHNQHLLTREQIIDLFESKLNQLNQEQIEVQNKRNHLNNLISNIRQKKNIKKLPLIQRKVFMENLREEALSTLKKKGTFINERHLNYLRREEVMIDKNNKKDFLLAIKSCIDFAKSNHLKLGPGRGWAAASIFLHSFGYSKLDPTLNELLPEIYLNNSPEIWFDVEFERGQIFIDYCKEISRNFYPGAIDAFKCPLLDIISNTHKKIGTSINYNLIDSNSDTVLTPFKKGDVEKIFDFDAPKDALIYQLILHRPEQLEWLGYEKVGEFLKTQKIINFRDVINLSSLLHRSHKQHESRLVEYTQRKFSFKEYDFLPHSINEILKPNFGMVLYHEEIIDIIKHFTQWDYIKCIDFERKLRRRQEDPIDYKEMCDKSSSQIVEFLREQRQYTFNKAHAWAASYFVKQTAVLKTLHKKDYFDEIAKWEDKHGFSWSEIGYIGQGIVLMQN